MKTLTAIGLGVVAACTFAMQSAARPAPRPPVHCQVEFGHGPGQRGHWARVCQEAR
jgi:Spy/CpxP family protein refolding chaperone